MLTLDPTTLFYWSLSDPPKKIKYSDSVHTWAKGVSSNAKPESRATSQTNSVKTRKSSSGKRIDPSLSASRSQATASSASVLTADIAITDNQVSQGVRIKQEKGTIFSFDGGLSDCEEVDGVERHAALVSPVKGKRRLDSEVSTHYDVNGCI
jgi:hypothetical protein